MYKGGRVDETIPNWDQFKDDLQRGFSPCSIFRELYST